MKSCKARLHTLTEENDYTILKHVSEHHHNSCETKPKLRETLTKLKATALSSQETSRSLIAATSASIGEDELAELPSVSSLSRNIRKWRQSSERVPTLPVRRSGFKISKEFRLLDSGEVFLQFDSGENYESRLLIFATDKGLDDLMKSTHLASDGTFKCVPQIYFQLFTLHIQIGYFSVPRLFALLPDKKEETYNRLFTKLLELRPNLNPQGYMMDFEKAHMNYVRHHFPNVSLSACLFHLSQSIYRKVVEIGFKERYHRDTEFSVKVKCFPALALLPTDDVVDGFDELADDEDIPHELVYMYIPKN